MADAEQVAMLLRSVEEWNAWRHEHPDAVIDLSEAELAGANLRGAYLHDATLDGTNAEGACFDDANLISVNASPVHVLTRGSVFVDSKVPNFRSASFRRALLNFSTFAEADFSGCAFDRSRLISASLSTCLAHHATFSSTIVGMTRFEATDLSTTIGLDRVKHQQPSSITTDTLRASRGRIADAFLRGCGLSELEILTAKLWDPDLTGDALTTLLYRIHDLKTTAPIQKRYVFISYSHADASFAGEIEKRLDAQNIRYWRDVHELKAGRIETQIDRAINLHSIVLLVLSKHSVASDWVEWEISKARAIEKKLKRDAICPVTLDDAWKTADWPGPLRRQIEDYHILDFSSPTEAQFGKLIDGLNLYY